MATSTLAPTDLRLRELVLQQLEWDSLVDAAGIGVTARNGTHGAEIPGTGYKVKVLAEVKDATSAWTPYLDYYDAAPTPTTGGGVYTSFDGAFYDE